MKKLLFFILLSFCFANDLDLMFWNVENLFDISDDPQKRDNDFLPGGVKRYTYRSYCLKVQHLADVINKLKPDMLAMVEVENQSVLEELREELNYAEKWQIIIDDGPDMRGIDPALMYRNDRFIYCFHTYYPVYFEDRHYHSRPIMRVDLAVIGVWDTLSIFINHWPSRRGGKETSDPYREYAAKILLHAVDSTLFTHPAYRIVITGDFNDDRHDECLKMLSSDLRIIYHEKSLPRKVNGTYYHEGEWIHFDHFLTANFTGAELSINKTEVIAPWWIREKASNGPLRYYKGIENLGGYSDHYPILLKLAIKRKNVE